LDATATVAGDARQATRHRLIDHETPGFIIITGKNETIGRHIRAANLRLVQKADEGGVRSVLPAGRIGRSGFYIETCMAGLPELPTKLACPDPEQVYFA